MANACGSGSLSSCRKKRLRSSGYLVPERQKESYRCSTNRSLASISAFDAIFFFRMNRRLLKVFLLDLSYVVGRTSSYDLKRRSLDGVGSTSPSFPPPLERHVASRFEGKQERKNLSLSLFKRVPRSRDATRCIALPSIGFSFCFWFPRDGCRDS